MAAPDFSGFKAIIDTREKLPYSLTFPIGPLRGKPVPFERKKLDSGDYSYIGGEERCCIERKSLMDLLGVIGNGRDRFEREIERLKRLDFAAIVVESNWSIIEAGQYYPSRIHPQAVIGSLLGWIAQGIPVLMLDNRARASEYVTRLLMHSYKRTMLREVADEKISGHAAPESKPSANQSCESHPTKQAS